MQCVIRLGVSSCGSSVSWEKGLFGNNLSRVILIIMARN